MRLSAAEPPEHVSDAEKYLRAGIDQLLELKLIDVEKDCKTSFNNSIVDTFRVE